MPISVNSYLEKRPTKYNNIFALHFYISRTRYFDFALKQLFSVLRSCVYFTQNPEMSLNEVIKY